MYKRQILTREPDAVLRVNVLGGDAVECRGHCLGKKLMVFERQTGQLDRVYPKRYTSNMKTIHTTETFDTWFASLTDKQAARRIQVRIDRAEDGNFGDCEPVGEGVSEMRIHYGPGYRVYFVQRGLEIVILLAGGDKSTQTKDIKSALKIARQL